MAKKMDVSHIAGYLFIIGLIVAIIAGLYAGFEGLVSEHTSLDFNCTHHIGSSDRGIDDNLQEDRGRNLRHSFGFARTASTKSICPRNISQVLTRRSII